MLFHSTENKFYKKNKKQNPATSVGKYKIILVYQPTSMHTTSIKHLGFRERKIPITINS